jgi:hypothetical protein
MSNRIAIIVPFRDREKHLAEFIPCLQAHMEGMAQPFKLFVVHQADRRPFNRGALKNAGFELARKEGFEWMAFHDVDYLPEGPSCDYSMPKDKPIHLASCISNSDYRQFYISFFGGVVLFTVDQFVRVNGYSNDYRGWGGEDDDLFSRMVKVGLAERSEIIPLNREIKFAHFPGEGATSLIRDIPLGLMEGSHTINMLVRPVVRRDLSELPHNRQFLKQFPLLYRHGFPIMLHSRTHLIGVHVDDCNRAAMPAVESASFFESANQRWEHATMVVDREAGESRMYSNGVGGEGFYGCVSPSTTGRDWWNSPIVIGRRDALASEGPESWMWFMGDIAQVSFWKRALGPDEIRVVVAGGRCEPTLLHAMEEGVEGQNLTFCRETIDTFVGPFAPLRRPGRYRNIDTREGGARLAEPEVSDNFLRSYRVRCGEIEPVGGLDTLRFRETARRELSDEHVMVDIELEV